MSDTIDYASDGAGLGRRRSGKWEKVAFLGSVLSGGASVVLVPVGAWMVEWKPAWIRFGVWFKLCAGIGLLPEAVMAGLCIWGIVRAVRRREEWELAGLGVVACVMWAGLMVGVFAVVSGIISFRLGL